MNNNNIEMDQGDVDWYNEFYKEEQKDFAPWYVFMLDFLKNEIKSENKILEIGCGQSKGLRWLRDKNLIDEKNIFAIDQSDEAIISSKKYLPQSNLMKGDAYHLVYNNSQFDYILLMEVIEHLQYPQAALAEIYRVLKPNGKLILSFPNYLNLPWLLVRVLAEKLNHPNWIVLQPTDKIYNTTTIINFCKQAGLNYKKIIGSSYFPPILYKYEKNRMTTFLNKIKLNHISFHPVLIFEKM